MLSTRLSKKYREEIVPKIKNEFGFKNNMAIPRVEKVVVNIGVGSILKNKEMTEMLKKDLAMLTGQFPSTRLAKISVAGFSLRRGMPVGLTTTLRGEKMYSFFDKLVSIALPRLRDFRGVSDRSFDAAGNYTLGMPEHNVFPEIDFAKSAAPHGLEISIVINSGDRKISKRILELMGMPFEKN